MYSVSVNRRDFLKLGGASIGAAAGLWYEAKQKLSPTGVVESVINSVPEPKENSANTDIILIEDLEKEVEFKLRDCPYSEDITYYVDLANAINASKSNDPKEFIVDLEMELINKGWLKQIDSDSWKKDLRVKIYEDITSGKSKQNGRGISNKLAHKFACANSEWLMHSPVNMGLVDDIDSTLNNLFDTSEIGGPFTDSRIVRFKNNKVEVSKLLPGDTILLNREGDEVNLVTVVTTS
ncbi:twin-arginine translocation signal domain-containing protein, partial [bacterium]|nr:twin-arginine translocation signal domain-containing protein [bacterium]